MFFEHCECIYDERTEVEVITIAMTVPAEQCRSEFAVVIIERQLATSGYECEDISEETYICFSTPCQYSNWTDVVPYVNATPVAVPVYQCRSGIALLGRRLQTAIGGYECNGTQCEECENITEETYICLSTLCQYSNWTDVVPYVNATPVAVPDYQCRSGIALPGERWQTAIGGYQCTGIQCEGCEDRREEIYICKVYNII